jgi:hypothetical protein
MFAPLLALAEDLLVSDAAFVSGMAYSFSIA